MSLSTTLQNVYYERVSQALHALRQKTGTARACYICRRPTSTVLATLKTEDFLYACEGHLTDPGFATQIAAPPAGPSAEDIRKVVSEYKLKEEKKKKKEEGKDDDKDKKDETKSPKTPETPPSVGVPTSNQPTHKKYALHRQIFESRKAEIRRKEQTVRAKEVSKGLPQVPRGSF